METKKEKTVEDLQREYTQLCSKAGHLQYQVSMLTAELSVVNESLKAINLEAAALAQQVKADKLEEEKASKLPQETL